MARMVETTVRDRVITVRATQQQRDLIVRAAQESNQTRSRFMIEAACHEAQEVVLDQTVFLLNADALATITVMPDDPREPSDELRRPLRSTPPWE